MTRILFAVVALTMIAAGAQAAEMTFYPLPTGAYPHDVAPAADGSVWYQRPARRLCSAASIRRPARSRRFRSGRALRRTA